MSHNNRCKRLLFDEKNEEKKYQNRVIKKITFGLTKTLKWQLRHGNYITDKKEKNQTT